MDQMLRTEDGRIPPARFRELATKGGASVDGARARKGGYGSYMACHDAQLRRV